MLFSFIIDLMQLAFELASHLFTQLDCTDCGALGRYNIHRLVLPSLNKSLDHCSLCCMFLVPSSVSSRETNLGVCSVYQFASEDTNIKYFAI